MDSRRAFSPKRIFKVIILGDSNVGKTCLTRRFAEHEFPRKTDATVGVDFHERTLTVQGEDVTLQLWDTAGQERFRKSMICHYYRNVHAVVLVYDVTKRVTFEGLPQWLDECENHDLTHVLKVLVGNKCDCKEEIVVSGSEARMFAEARNMLFFETSALDNNAAENVEFIFRALAHQLKALKPTPLAINPDTRLTQVPGSAIRLATRRRQPSPNRQNSGCPC